ncbi:MAG: stage V sporulation protein AD [Acetanaerobacterium sp.]
MPTRQGRYTLRLDSCPSIAAYASVAGKKEGEGPLARYFDMLCTDTTMGENTWEKAESRLQKDAVNKALDKAQLSPTQIDYVFAGDLLNQSISSTYGLRDLGVPFVGLFGACSTMAESLCLGSIFVDTGAAGSCVCVTSSHFCSAERQFRYPLEYGGLRAPTSQWTVTGSGCAIVRQSALAPYVRAVTIGKIQDMGITDVNNMGAAMAPAAADTLLTFFTDTATAPDSYDLILTGDLGQVGSQLVVELLKREGCDISGRHSDCGLLIYDNETQDVGAGGSGCGCSATVLCSYILSRIQDGSLSNVLFVATGALMSPTSLQQGESIPGVAHLVHLSSTKA